MPSAAPRLTVVGSYAVGLTIRTDRFPLAGQTVLGQGFREEPGGKGSNQAIQAARLGAEVAFVGVVGRDRYGDEAVALLGRERVDVRHVVRADAATGAGMIIVNQVGENMIVVDPGANGKLDGRIVGAAGRRIASSGAVVAQLEIPVAAVIESMRRGRANGVMTILNPAPAQDLPEGALECVDIVTPNAGELARLVGAPEDDPNADQEALCRSLLQRGPRAVVLTRGDAGALVVTREAVVPIPAFRVHVRDTTGAGDAFTAALAVELAAGSSLLDAARFAAAAGALACTGHGVVSSLPERPAVEALMAGLAPRVNDHPEVSA